MKNRIFAFIIFLVSFMAFTPAHAEPTDFEIEKFLDRFLPQLASAEKTLDAHYRKSGQERVMEIKGPTAVVGDLHGDLYTFRAIRDQLRTELVLGHVQNVVFLGDIMDRGSGNAQVLLELLEFYNDFPNQVYILRGNHETISMFEGFSKDYNPARNDPFFRGIDYMIFKKFFDTLPYAVVINGHTLAVHGGIPREDLWDEFFGVGLPKEGERGFDVVMSAIWADYDPGGDAMKMNGSRTCWDYRIILYSEEDVSRFCSRWRTKALLKKCKEPVGKIKRIIRAHQPSLGSTFHQSSEKGIVTTVFSALENQNEEFETEGASVALVPVEDVPPVRYMAIHPHGDRERICTNFYPLGFRGLRRDGYDPEDTVSVVYDSPRREPVCRDDDDSDSDSDDDSPIYRPVAVIPDGLERSRRKSSFEGVDILRSNVSASDPDQEYRYNPHDESERAFYEDSSESESDSDSDTDSDLGSLRRSPSFGDVNAFLRSDDFEHEVDDDERTRTCKRERRPSLVGLRGDAYDPVCIGRTRAWVESHIRDSESESETDYSDRPYRYDTSGHVSKRQPMSVQIESDSESDSDSDYEFGHIDSVTRNFISHRRSGSRPHGLTPTRSSYSAERSLRNGSYIDTDSAPDVSFRPMEGSGNSSWTSVRGSQNPSQNRGSVAPFSLSRL